MKEVVEHIEADGKRLGTIIRSFHPSQTWFPTPPEYPLQVGFVVYPAGGEVARHRHRPIERHLQGTAEVILVREGRCEVDFYDSVGRIVATRELQAGDILFLVGGGHGFRMIEPTILLEVKQGPYAGLEEKERF